MFAILLYFKRFWKSYRLALPSFNYELHCGKCREKRIEWKLSNYPSSISSSRRAWFCRSFCCFTNFHVFVCVFFRTWTLLRCIYVCSMHLPSTIAQSNIRLWYVAAFYACTMCQMSKCLTYLIPFFHAQLTASASVWEMVINNLLAVYYCVKVQWNAWLNHPAYIRKTPIHFHTFNYRSD